MVTAGGYRGRILRVEGMQGRVVVVIMGLLPEKCKHSPGSAGLEKNRRMN